MRIAAAVIFSVAAAATTASAQPNRLTDVEYLQAARCRGLAASETLGAMDTASIDALLKSQRMGRAGYIIDKAEQSTADAKRTANRAKAERQTGLLAERAGACQRYFG